MKPIYDRVWELKSEGKSASKIRKTLIEEGYKSKRGRTIQTYTIYELLKKKKPKSETRTQRISALAIPAVANSGLPARQLIAVVGGVNEIADLIRKTWAA